MLSFKPVSFAIEASRKLLVLVHGTPCNPSSSLYSVFFFPFLLYIINTKEKEHVLRDMAGEACVYFCVYS